MLHTPDRLKGGNPGDGLNTPYSRRYGRLSGYFKEADSSRGMHMSPAAKLHAPGLLPMVAIVMFRDRNGAHFFAVLLSEKHHGSFFLSLRFGHGTGSYVKIAKNLLVDNVFDSLPLLRSQRRI